MSILSWNVRGLNSTIKDRHIREIIRNNNACILGLTETKLALTTRMKVVSLCYNSNFDFLGANATKTLSGEVILIWDSDYFCAKNTFQGSRWGNSCWNHQTF